MDTSVESITIQSLDYKLDSKAGISKGKKRAYSRVMTEALLSEGMTDQNQVRFCHAFVATGIAPPCKTAEFRERQRLERNHSISYEADLLC